MGTVWSLPSCCKGWRGRKQRHLAPRGPECHSGSAHGALGARLHLHTAGTPFGAAPRELQGKIRGPFPRAKRLMQEGSESFCSSMTVWPGEAPLDANGIFSKDRLWDAHAHTHTRTLITDTFTGCSDPRSPSLCIFTLFMYRNTGLRAQTRAQSSWFFTGDMKGAADVPGIAGPGFFLRWGLPCT